MCSPFKAIKKIFKKVVKVVKKVLPVVLVAAAIYFTAGMAFPSLALPGTGAVAGLSGGASLGLSGTLGSIVGGAAQGAIAGSAIGGATALLTGGDVSKGLLRGAAVGAVTGGVVGGLTGPASLGANPLPGQGGPSASTPAGGAQAAAGRVLGTGIDTGGGGGPGLLSRVGGFIEKNPTLVGGAIQGLGSGLGSFAEAGATVEAAELEAEQEAARRAEIAANFGVGGGGGLLTGSSFDRTARPTPAQQFNPTTVLAKARGSMWRYNPATGQLELTPTA